MSGPADTDLPDVLDALLVADADLTRQICVIDEQRANGRDRILDLARTWNNGDGAGCTACRLDVYDDVYAPFASVRPSKPHALAGQDCFVFRYNCTWCGPGNSVYVPIDWIRRQLAEAPTGTPEGDPR